MNKIYINPEDEHKIDPTDKKIITIFNDYRVFKNKVRRITLAKLRYNKGYRTANNQSKGIFNVKTKDEIVSGRKHLVLKKLPNLNKQISPVQFYEKKEQNFHQHHYNPILSNNYMNFANFRAFNYNSVINYNSNYYTSNFINNKFEFGEISQEKINLFLNNLNFLRNSNMNFLNHNFLSNYNIKFEDNFNGFYKHLESLEVIKRLSII